MAHRTFPKASEVTATRAQVLAAQTGTLQEARSAATDALVLAEKLALYIKDVAGNMKNGGTAQDPERYLTDAIHAWGLSV